MSIPMPFIEDIVGLVELLLRFIVEVLKRFVEKDDLFAISPIGTTMQDSGKRKRSNCVLIHLLGLKYFEILLTSSRDLAEIRDGNLSMLADLLVIISFFLSFLSGLILGVNLYVTFCLKLFL